MQELTRLPLEAAADSETSGIDSIDVAKAKEIVGAEVAGDIDSFVNAGWQFSAPGNGALCFPVYLGSDRRLRIGSESLVAKFSANMTKDAIQAVLKQYGLDVDRWIEPNQTLAYVTDTHIVPDVVAVSKALSAEPSVQFAEPVLHEAISSR